MPLFLTVKVHHQDYNSDTRKSEKINTESAASTHIAEKIISKAIPKSTSLTELAYKQDLLNPVDPDFSGKKITWYVSGLTEM